MTPFVRLWIWIFASASLAGWGLSAVGQLNRVGYAMALAVFAIFVFLRRKDLEFASTGKFSRRKIFSRRFRRPLPLVFATLAALIFLGGAMYPPTHYVALTYHIPRVLHWLAAGQWHWIHTSDERMNYSGCDFEWLFTPLVLFAKSYRVIFLFNFISFLLLPGLIFSVFTRLGVSPRVAWRWMWLLPTGYIFLLQAGSAGNDTFSAVFALAAIDFGCRAWASRRLRDLWFSVLAASLMTGVKPISAPLLLPWAILVFPLLPVLRRKWLATLPVLAVAVVASFFPIALMNRIHCGDWLGTSLDSPRLEVHRPLIGILGNGFELLQDNFVPSLFPMANWWNQHVARFIPSGWIMTFQPGFFSTGELPTEDWSGIGFGLSVLLVASVAASLLTRRSSKTKTYSNRPIPAGLLRWVILTPWCALAVYCANAGMATPARLVAPYYPALLPSLLIGVGQARVVRRRWWRALAWGVVILAFVVLALSVDRPLWPAQTILTKLTTKHPSNHALARALEVYTVYAKRSDPLADVRAILPAHLKAVGFIGTPDDCEISLWLPLGSRRVEQFLLTDPPERFREKHVQYVVVGGRNLELRGTTLDAWLQRTGAKLVASTNATLKVSEGPQKWFVVRFKP